MARVPAPPPDDPPVHLRAESLRQFVLCDADRHALGFEALPLDTALTHPELVTCPDCCRVVAEMRSAWEAGYRAATGRRATPGRPPFRESPEGAAALARIAQLRATGLSYPAIARELNAEKVPSAAGGPWRASMVHALYQQAVRHP